MNLPPPATVDRRRDLADTIVAGVQGRDPVRVHGAIVAALQAYDIHDTQANVFRPALRRVGLTCSARDRTQLAAAFHSHVRRALRGDPI